MPFGVGLKIVLYLENLHDIFVTNKIEFIPYNAIQYSISSQLISIIIMDHNSWFEMKCHENGDQFYKYKLTMTVDLYW